MPQNYVDVGDCCRLVFGYHLLMGKWEFFIESSLQILSYCGHVLIGPMLCPQLWVSALACR